MSQRISSLLLCVFLVLMQGCVAIQSFPSVARAGDTITLALGSVEGLDKSKIQLSYIPQSTSVPINLTANIRNVLKVYPDRASPASMADGSTAHLTVVTGHAMWLNIAVVDLPATLPTGPGYFRVTFSASVRQPSPSNVTSAEAVNIGMEIVPGSGAPNNFLYYGTELAPIFPGNFKQLEPLPRVVLRSVWSANYGAGPKFPAAAEYRIKLPVSGEILTLDNANIHVIWDFKPGEDSKQIQLSWSRTADVIKVNVLAPTEFTLAEQLFQFSIVINPGWSGHVINAAGIPQLLSVRYYNLNGQLITPTVMPEVVVMK